MFIQYVRKAVGLNSLLVQVVSGCCLGLVLGLAAQWISALVVLEALLALLLGYAILKRPEIALFGILTATSSIVYEEQLPMISVGVSLHIPDILLMGLFGLILVRWLAEPDFKLIRTPLDKPLLTFFGLTLFSTMVALYQSTVDIEIVRRAFRFFFYYLTFFVITNLVRGRRQINLLLNGILLLAVVIAGAIVLQFILGSSVQLIPGRVETLDTQGTMYEDITRVLPPGWAIVFVSLLVILCALVLEEITLRSWLKFFLTGLFGLAIIFTFLRSYWGALLIVFLLLGYLLKRTNRKKLIGVGLMIVLLSAMVYPVISIDPTSRSSRLVAAAFDRLYTLFDSGTFQGEDGSLNWRMIENEYAFSAISTSPWIGLGMGFTYRPLDPRLDQPNASALGIDFRRHIHNGHLWILLQSGFLGYASFLWLSWAFLSRGFKYWHKVQEPKFKAVVLGFSLAYLAVFIASVANSSFTQWRWTPILGIMMGVNEVLLMRAGVEPSA